MPASNGRYGSDSTPGIGEFPHALREFSAALRPAARTRCGERSSALALAMLEWKDDLVANAVIAVSLVSMRSGRIGIAGP